MAYEEFERRLTEYGLQSNETKAYITLALRGPKKASDLAKACELSRMDTYRILRRLESKGLVETVLHKPMRFAAVPPEKAFDILIGTAKERISILEQEKKRLFELWNSIPREPLDFEDERFRILWGRVEFFSTVKRICSSSIRQICILTTRNGLSRLYHGGLDDLLQTLNGIDVKILAEVDHGNLEAVERFASITSLRHVKPTSAQFVIVDDSGIVVNMALDDSTILSSENDTSLWTNSRGYIGLMQRLFDKLWVESVDAEKAVQSVTSGLSLPETSVLYQKEQIWSKQIDLIRSAKKRIMILTPYTMIPRLLGESLNSALENCRQRNVEIQVLADFDEQRTAELKRISDRYDLRLVNFKVTTETLAVDDSATLLVSPTVGGVPEAAFWTTQRDYSELILNFLEQVWSNARDPSPYFLRTSLTRDLNTGLTRIAEELRSKGWEVNMPGVIEGISLVKHSFNLVATFQREILIIDYFLSNEPVATELLAVYGAKKSDIKPSRVLLLVAPKADQEANRLAKFFGVDLIEGSDASLLLTETRRTLGLG
ncbi:MAG: hypothetical protein HYU39_08730 [Thaumarchaeota archaeon]|nr:hypothetical protein [Nitrososphaerota archaeon]